MSFWKRKPLSVASRVALKLVLLSTCTLTFVHLLGILPNPREEEIRRRAILCESLAITSSLLAQRRDDDGLRKNLSAIVERNPEILSACIRRTNGRILHQVGDHQRYWLLGPDAGSTSDNVYVPVTSGDHPWGAVEVSFADQGGYLAALLRHPIISLGLVSACLNCLIFRWYMARALSYLDPTKSVPAHVRATLDTFSEAVVVLDNERRIVLANDKFGKHFDTTEQEVLGKPIDRFPWLYEGEEVADSLWRGAGPSPKAAKIGLRLDAEHRTFLVNSSAILANDGGQRGTIASFDDITPLEQKREELSRMLSDLQASRDELKVRNQELQYLATRDSLTGCLNRRAFFETFELRWNAARRYQQPLSCLMVDVDHFKSVNDNFGHGVGDEVLRGVAKKLLETARDSDVVCRYGGEEFCVLLPETDLERACRAAERLRQAIADLQFNDLSVTASLGVSSLSLGAADPQQLLDQADKCLYAAKRSGRNQVSRWDQLPDEVADEIPGDAKSLDLGRDVSIPYPAVASLLSALAYRDADTAAHSTRVAELCVATARGMMSLREAYVLEIAALLHDIGKIGVPDAILLKPGRLTAEEWQTMKIHDRIGVEIVEASFSNQELVDIVRHHHAHFAGNPDAPQLPRGEDIPLGARIVAIADAYDAMVSNRVYRQGRPPEQAFEELRRCGGRQFDPELVERFIAVAKAHKPVQLSSGSKQHALQIGLQIERLAEAVDASDSEGIQALATRLVSTAAHCRIPEIQAVAAEIKQAADDGGDVISLISMVNELIDLSQSLQRVYVDVESETLPKRSGGGATSRQREIPERPAVQFNESGGVVLNQSTYQSRPNQVRLSRRQREQVGRLWHDFQMGALADVENTLRAEVADGCDDVLLRFTFDDEVNLTQIDRAARAVNVVIDTIAGLDEWAILRDAHEHESAGAG